MDCVQTGDGDVRIEMLGHFRVAVGDREIVEGDWPARRAQELVALLALAGGRRLLRDQVVEQLWPHLGAQAGAANLRKAAHHARRTLEDPESVVLRSGHVELFPARALTTDVERFLDADQGGPRMPLSDQQPGLGLFMLVVLQPGLPFSGAAEFEGLHLTSA